MSVHTTTKMIKLSFDDNDFKIAHPIERFCFQSDDNEVIVV
jgi:hypothetical protein